MTTTETVTLRDALDLYVGSLKKKGEETGAEQAILRFVNWCGADRAISELAPPEVGEYGGHAMGLGGGSQAPQRLREVRKFLTFAKKKGLTEQNLAPHLRIPRSKTNSRQSAMRGDREIREFTEEGHQRLMNDLERLKAERGPIAAEIKRAAADKDIRENAPLEAAREHLGLVESRIRAIEESLKEAVVLDPSQKRAGKAAGVGSVVRLEEVGSGRTIKYTLVDASESNPLEGKISKVSPVGKMLLRKTAGQEVEVVTPRGKQQYRILKVS